MGNIKEIFKILLVIQIISCALAFYGHPDAESIDFGSDPSHDELIIEAAIRRGMDGEAVAELLRTKEPVVKIVTSPNGVTKTTTYKLDDDGSISSKTVTERRNSYTYTSGAVPDRIPIDDLHKSPTGTVTKTFTDENGNKVTQTVSVSQPKPSTVLDTDDLTGDWFNKPFPTWQQQAPSSSGHRIITKTFTGPNGERRTVQSWSSDPNFNEPESTLTTSHDVSAPNYHRTITKTFTGPNGEKRVVTTTSNDPEGLDFPAPKKPKYPSIGSDNWPGFDFSGLSQPWGSTDDTEDSDGWTIVEGNSDVETSTKKRFESWTPKTWNFPEYPTFTYTTTTAKPNINIQPDIPPRKPLPNLDDFLKKQYGSTTTSKSPTSTTVKATTTPKTPTIPPKSVITTTTKKPVHINIDELPVTEILHNGKPVDETFLKNLPPHLKPKLNTENVLKIENKHPIEELPDFGVDVFTPTQKTNIRKFTDTHSGPEKPTFKDLDPQIQDTLRKAGISPDDVTNIDGDTITKTRTEPDGRVVTTTFKIKTVPSVVPPLFKEKTPTVLHSTYKKIIPEAQSKPQDNTAVLHPHSYTPYTPLDIPKIPALTPLSPQFSPISEFLAKLGLTKLDISSQSGRLSKTFVDDDGQVLTATFVLSSPMTRRSIPDVKEKPQK